MNTHIIISIVDIEARIAELKKIRDSASEENKAFYASAISELIMFKDMIGKQISLDEKNIEAKATKYTSNIKENLLLNELVGRKRGYKQALKDLLL